MMMSSLLQINSKEACTDNMVDIITRSIFDVSKYILFIYLGCRYEL